MNRICWTTTAWTPSSTVRGIEVSEHALSFEAIRDVVTGVGHFLGHPPTFSRMKTDYQYPDSADRRSISEWQYVGAGTARDVTRDRVQKILAAHYPRHISDAVDDRLRAAYQIVLPRARMRAGNGIW